jgi:hypothetical protein
MPEKPATLISKQQALVRYGTILCKVTLTAPPIRLSAAKVILALCLSKKRDAIRNGAPNEHGTLATELFDDRERS